MASVKNNHILAALLSFIFFSMTQLRGQGKYLIPFLDGKLYGYANEFGEIKIRPAYLDVEMFVHSKAIVVDSNGRNIIDTNGRLILKRSYGRFLPLDLFNSFGIARCFKTETEIDIVNLSTGEFINSGSVLNDYSTTLNRPGINSQEARYLIIDGENTSNRGIYDLKRHSFLYRCAPGFNLRNYDFEYYLKNDSSTFCFKKSKKGAEGFSDSIAFVKNGSVSKFYDEEKYLEVKKPKKLKQVDNDRLEIKEIITPDLKPGQEEKSPSIFHRLTKTGLLFYNSSFRVDSLNAVYDSIRLPDKYYQQIENWVGVKKNNKWALVSIPSKKIVTGFDFDSIYSIRPYWKGVVSLVKKGASFIFYKNNKSISLGEYDKIEILNINTFLTIKDNQYGLIFFPCSIDSTCSNFLSIPPLYQSKFTEVIPIYPFMSGTKDRLKEKPYYAGYIIESVEGKEEPIKNRFGYRTFRKLISFSGVQFFRSQ